MNLTEHEFANELRQLFAIEAEKHVQTISAALIELHQNEAPGQQHRALHSIRQVVHGLKGGAHSANLPDIIAICQSMETTVTPITAGERPFAPADLASLQREADRLMGLLTARTEEQEVASAPPPPPPPERSDAPGTGVAPTTAKPLKALVIEDSACDALFLLGHLRSGGYDVFTRRVEDAESLTQALADEQWDIIFSDHNMPGFSSIEALKILRATKADIPFIIVSGSIGEELAVTAMKAGAQDYLMKGNLTRLVAAVERELQDARDRQARREAERDLLSQKEALRIAREIQGHLFPARPPAIPGFDIAGATQPAEATGGDYFDFISTPREESFIVVGDVTGHGLGPALLMADVRAYLRALIPDHASIEDVLSRANRLLREDVGDFRFITLLIAGLFPSRRGLTFINAGHPSGYVLDRDGNIKADLSPSVPALGLDADMIPPPAAELTLAPSDMVVLLTDGVIEATTPTGEEFGIGRFLNVIHRERDRPAAEIIAAVFDAVRNFTEGSGLQDDLTTVIIKVLPE